LNPAYLPNFEFLITYCIQPLTPCIWRIYLCAYPVCEWSGDQTTGRPSSHQLRTAISFDRSRKHV